jgi:hypothetical protein
LRNSNIRKLVSVFQIEVMKGNGIMKKVIFAAALVITFLSFATVSLAAINGVSIAETLNSFIRYEFKTVRELPDKVVEVTGATSAEETTTIVRPDGPMTFKPLEVTDGWLFELAGGGSLSVITGRFQFGEGDFSERYIDITGKNGTVRYLKNSYSVGD